MAEEYVMNNGGRCGKYIVQTLQTPPLSEKFQEFYATYAKRLLWMDKNVVPGAFQMNLSWYHAASDVRPLYMHDEHFHDFDEMIGFLGSNPDDPYDLGGEIEIGLDGALHRLTKSSVIFVPGGMKHLPLSILRLERPILHFSISMNGVYSNTRTATGKESVLDGKE